MKNLLSPYELIRVGPDCRLDEIMKSLEPRKVGHIMGIPVKVCKWMPPNVMALFTKLGETEFIILEDVCTEEHRAALGGDDG